MRQTTEFALENSEGAQGTLANVRCEHVLAEVVHASEKTSLNSAKVVHDYEQSCIERALCKLEFKRSSLVIDNFSLA